MVEHKRAAADPAPNRASRSYFSDSRDLLTSVVLILPLFVAYQIGVLTTGGPRVERQCPRH